MKSEMRRREERLPGKQNVTDISGYITVVSLFSIEFCILFLYFCKKIYWNGLGLHFMHWIDWMHKIKCFWYSAFHAWFFWPFKMDEKEARKGSFIIFILNQNKVLIIINKKKKSVSNDNICCISLSIDQINWIKIVKFVKLNFDTSLLAKEVGGTCLLPATSAK